MNAVIKKLYGKEDFEKFLAIATNNKKIGGTSPLSFEVMHDLHLKYFGLSTEKYTGIYNIFAYIKDNNIVSTIGLAHLENKSRGKFWLIGSFFSVNKTNIFSFNKPEIGLLVKHAFEYSEQLGYFEYYYAIAASVSEVYEKQINKNIYIPLYRYERITLDTIPKNTILHEGHLYNKLLGNEPKPHDMIIKKRILKKCFRKSE